jgi:uncharacterized SAM-binding protein YcdF (DUF218 family)
LRALADKNPNREDSGMELTPFLYGVYKLVKYALYPLTWVLLVMMLTTLWLWLPLTAERIRRARISAVAGLALLLAVSSPLVARPLLGNLEAWHAQPPPSTDERYEAIVVLGGGVLEQGTLRPAADLSSYSKNRVTCGVDLYEQGYAPKLVFSGGNGHAFKDGPKDALEMTRWAQRLGVSKDVIVVEDLSRTTYENAAETKRLLGPVSIVLVTSASHLPRATALFRKQGFLVTPMPCDFFVQNRPEDTLRQLDPFDILPSVQAIEQTTGAVSEWTGMAIYWLTGNL